jgi:hypothetical protein
MNRLMNQHVLAAAVAAALLPTVAMAHNQGARVSVGGTYQHLAIGQAAGNLPAITFGISQDAGGIGIRARLSLARGAGAELDSGSVRLLAYPRNRVSPYLSVGGLSLSNLAGTATETTYAVNPTTGVIAPQQVPVAVPPASVVTGFAFAGLHASVPVNSRLSLRAHAAIGAGLGGAATGLPPAAGARSDLARSVGVAMRYRLAGGPILSIGYDQESLPMRGAVFKTGGIEASVGRRFY